MCDDKMAHEMLGNMYHLILMPTETSEKTEQPKRAGKLSKEKQYMWSSPQKCRVKTPK